MSQEIEVKYLVRQPLFPLDGVHHEKISQGYIAIVEKENVVRARQKGHRFFLTVKGAGMMSRREVEIELRQVQFEELWPLTEGKRVEKTRYFIEYPPHLIELDVFEGDLKGLVVAEVEFGSEEEAEKFTPPDWFVKEVTWDSRYQNSNLARFGMPAEN